MGEGRPARAGGRADKKQRALRPCSGMSLGRRGGHTPRHADTRHGTQGARGGVLLRETGRTDAGGQTPRAKRASAHGRRLGGPARRQGQWNGCSQRPGEGREGEGRGGSRSVGKVSVLQDAGVPGMGGGDGCTATCHGLRATDHTLKMVQRVSFT